MAVGRLGRHGVPVRDLVMGERGNGVGLVQILAHLETEDNV